MNPEGSLSTTESWRTMRNLKEPGDSCRTLKNLKGSWLVPTNPSDNPRYLTEQWRNLTNLAEPWRNRSWGTLKTLNDVWEPAWFLKVLNKPLWGRGTLRNLKEPWEPDGFCEMKTTADWQAMWHHQKSAGYDDGKKFNYSLNLNNSEMSLIEISCCQATHTGDYHIVHQC